MRSLYLFLILLGVGSVGFFSFLFAQDTGAVISGHIDTEIPGTLSGYASVTVETDTEFSNALTWMHDEGMTKYDTIEDFRPYDVLTRQEAAKFFSIFTKQILLKTLDTSKYCAFDDLEDADPSLKNSILESCMLGIFQGSGGYFFPNQTFTKAQALAVLIRGLEGHKDETGEYWWAEYLVRARDLGLTKEFIVADLDRPVTRYEVALLLWRAGQKQ